MKLSTAVSPSESTNAPAKVGAMETAGTATGTATGAGTGTATETAAGVATEVVEEPGAAEGQAPGPGPEATAGVGTAPGPAPAAPAARATGLQQVVAPQKLLREYLRISEENLIHEIRDLCRQLRGVRLLHLNSTALGGGVAELLYTMVPLERECGLDAEWRLLAASPELFRVTKSFHNGLQSEHVQLEQKDLDLYLHENERSAQLLVADDYDVIIVHDPQPAAVLHFAGFKHTRWVWRCHIDSSAPDPAVWEFMRTFVEEYDAAVFTKPEFVPWDLAGPTLHFIA